MMEAVIFDIGNVLLRFDFSPVTAHLAAHSDRTLKAAAGEFETIKSHYERGDFGTREFLAAMREALGYRGSDSEFTHIYQRIFTPIEPMHELAVHLARRHRIFLLSNTSEIHVEYFEAEYPVFGLFHDRVYSHLAGCAKPAPEIFSLALERFGTEPGRTLFVDDLETNVAAGSRAGLRAIHYDYLQHDKFLEALREIGLQ